MKPKTRDRLLAGVSLTIGLTLGGLTVSRLAADPIIATEVIGVEASNVRVAGEFRLQLLGDTMLADGAQRLIDQEGYDAPLSRLQGVLDGDYTVINLETPVTTRADRQPLVKDYSYHSDPESLLALKRAGVDAVSLANNHSFDQGELGFRDTISAGIAIGLPTFGAGEDLTEARRPLMIDSPEGRIAIVALTEDFGVDSTATAEHPGTVAFDALEVQRGVDAARDAGADIVVAFVHWGENYQPVDSLQRSWGDALAHAGYDAVVGAGPHISQSVSLEAGVPIAYSIGNFAFGAPGRFDTLGQPGFGLALTLVIKDGRISHLEAGCLVTDNERVHYRPRLCRPAKSSQVLTALIPGAVMSGDRAVLRLGE